MTTLIIQSDSEENTNLLMHLAEVIGLSAKTQEFESLDIKAMVKGIGGKATYEELIDYFSKEKDAEPIIHGSLLF